jgi:hypothetical protein
MTQKELIYEVRERFKIMVDDVWPTNEYIAFLINSARGAVMQQRYSDPRNIVPYNEYQIVSLTIGPTAVTNEALPAIIKTTGNASSPLKAYTSGDLQTGINVVSLDRLPFVGYNPFTKDLIYCAVRSDNKILFNSNNDLYKLLNAITVRGLFEDPEDAYKLANPNSTTDFWDTEYPISNGVLLDVNKIVDQKMAQLLNTQKDTLNDGTEERLAANPQGDK